MQLLQSRALPLGYPAVEGAPNIVDFPCRASSLRQFSRALPQSYRTEPLGTGVGNTIDLNGST